MDVTLPNGKVIRGVPDGTPKQAIMAKAISAGLAIESDFPAERAAPTDERGQYLDELAEEIGPIEALAIGMGRGFSTLARGVGIMDPEPEIVTKGIRALKEDRPYTTGAGEIIGEAAPFMIPGAGIARIGSMAGRVAAGGTLGGVEAATIAKGTGQDVVPAAGMGVSIGAGAEILFPVIGRIGRKIFERIRGSVPEGAMLDAAGNPTPELQGALDEAGMTFDDLAADAQEVIQRQKPGAAPEQVATAARFAEEGVPITKGELTKEFPQQATEARLLESASDKLAEPFRQFKLKQSEAIKRSMSDNLDMAKLPEETGQRIQEALVSRKKMLRTQKNDLYRQAADNAKSVGGIPIFVDNIAGAVPDADTLEDLAITAPASMISLNKLMARYGITEPLAPTILKEQVEIPRSPGDLGMGRPKIEQTITEIPAPAMLTIDSMERFRKSLNAIERGDITGATTVAIAPIRKALDEEVAELATTLEAKGLPPSIIEPLKEARKTVRQLKIEFSPQAITGRMIDVKRDGVTPIMEASQVYSKLAAKSQPVENVRRTIDSLMKSGDKGRQAIADIQTSTMLDLIESGFGTESRKIDGIRTFNPIAFRNRVKAIGDDKLKSIFGTNKAALNKIRNIDKIAADLVPPSGAMPKGSASVIMDLANKLGLISISSKVPGGGLLIEGVRSIAEGAKTRKQVEQALNAKPEVKRLASMLDDDFPGIAAALGIAGISTEQESE